MDRPIPPEPTHAEPATPSVDPETRRAILERVARHELTAEQAAAALRGDVVEVEAPGNTEQAEAPAPEHSDKSAAEEQSEVTSNE